MPSWASAPVPTTCSSILRPSGIVVSLPAVAVPDVGVVVVAPALIPLEDSVEVADEPDVVELDEVEPEDAPVSFLLWLQPASAHTASTASQRVDRIMRVTPSWRRRRERP